VICVGCIDNHPLEEQSNSRQSRRSELGIEHEIQKRFRRAGLIFCSSSRGKFVVTTRRPSFFSKRRLEGSWTVALSDASLQAVRFGTARHAQRFETDAAEGAADGQEYLISDQLRAPAPGEHGIWKRVKAPRSGRDETGTPAYYLPKFVDI
jgi:hypothetical protein